MKAGQLLFYATRNDLETVVLPIENATPLTYVLTGLFELPRVQQWDSLFEYPSIGVSKTGIRIRDDTFLVVRRQERFRPKKIRQRRGGFRYAVDQEANIRSIALAPGGLYGEGACMVSGDVGTCSTHKVSVELYGTFAKAFRKRFTKIQSYYIGPDALELFERGTRFTNDIRGDPLYDLRKPE